MLKLMFVLVFITLVHHNILKIDATGFYKARFIISSSAYVKASFVNILLRFILADFDDWGKKLPHSNVS